MRGVGGTPWTKRGRVQRWRDRHGAVDAAFTLQEHLRDHRTTKNVALVAHFGFLSVFPLMLVLTTVLGFLLEDRPHWRERIIDSAAERIPIIGPQLADSPERLKGNAVVLVVGLLTTLWAGTKAFLAMQTALDDIAEIPLDQRANAAMSRLKALVGIALIGGAQLVTAATTAFVGVAGLAGISKGLLVVAAVVINIAVVLGTYRWLCTRHRPWRELLPGAVFAGIIFAGLQLVGTTLVSRAISKASPVYGTFAAVIALLSWLSMHVLVALLGAELNVLISDRHRRRDQTITGRLPDMAIRQTTAATPVGQGGD